MNELRCVVALLVQLAAISSNAQAEQVVFLPGDACFTSLVTPKSNFLNGGTNLEAVVNFGGAISMQDRFGVRMDISTMPAIQLTALRQAVRDLLRANENDAVVLCICHPDFDFTNFWLGVPYNSAIRYRLQPRDIGGGTLGPPGVINVATRSSLNCPPLPVQLITTEQVRLNGDVSVALLKASDVVNQRNRLVVDPDGSTRQINFLYQPKEIVCFEEGDAFFVALVDPFLHSPSDSVALDYYLLPRRLPVSIDNVKDETFPVPSNAQQVHPLDLPIRSRGQGLVVRDIHPNLYTVLKETLSNNPPNRWYVFVVDRNYNPQVHRLGIRYNQRQFLRKDEALSFEYAECNSRPFTEPVGNPDDNWPPLLNASWQDNTFVASMNEVALVITQYPPQLPFYSDGKASRRPHLHVHGRESVEVWNGQTLLKRVQLD